MNECRRNIFFPFSVNLQLQGGPCIHQPNHHTLVPFFKIYLKLTSLQPCGYFSKCHVELHSTESSRCKSTSKEDKTSLKLDGSSSNV